MKLGDWWFKRDTKQTQAGGLKALEVSGELLSSIRSGWMWGSYGMIYRRQAAVRTVVDFLARNIAQLNPKVYVRLDDEHRLERDDHPLAERLRKPNPEMSRYRHLFATVADKAIYDIAYWRKIKQRGRITALVRIAPPLLTEEKEDVWRLTTNDEILRRDELVIFSGYDPNGDGSVPPLETLRRLLAADWAAQAHRERYWDGGARPSGWVERPLDAPEWTGDQRDRWRADLETVKKSSQTPVFEDGMKYNISAFSPHDSEYIEGVKLTIEQVCRAYGVPSSLIGGAGETKANVESFHRQLYQDVLGPWLRLIQDEIELQLLPEYDSVEREGRIYVEFNLREKLKGSFEEEAKTLVTAVGVPYMAVNQALARLNLPKIEDPAFDVPVQPMNVLYGGQPAPTVPTEDPGTPETASLEETKLKADIARYEASLKQFFDVQERDVLAKVGLNGAIWADCKGWDRELALRLFNWAPHLEGRFTDIAKSINDATYDEIREELEAGGVVPLHKRVKSIFVLAKEQRAAEIAKELVDKGALDDA